ncbi:hypothetical protein [Aquiflexum lacus]|uniref:hypothetical protein n=1 Tax=Aquiflexum lacus TaxID=2483805 RepID=UPI001893B94F|nr:hypothetical protein [Aquiflexum lacus]
MDGRRETGDGRSESLEPNPVLMKIGESRFRNQVWGAVILSGKNWHLQKGNDIGFCVILNELSEILIAI